MSRVWSLRIEPDHAQQLIQHLFPGDGDEHGAVLGAALVSTEREHRLLVKQVYIARDGIDYVPGKRGYRMLTADFVRDTAFACADQGLAYLPVHNHGTGDSVRFSSDDLESHKRGYPALVQLTSAPVAGIVFASNAVAGDIWLPDGSRFPLRDLVVPGRRSRILLSDGVSTEASIAEATHDRQSLLLGRRGQQILADLKVGIIGAGGVGSLLIEFLARLGVGHLVVADPDRIECSNFSRVVGSRPSDLWPWPWRGRARKVDIAERVAKNANRGTRFEKIFGDFRRPNVVRRFIDCDYLFLAADPMSVRLLFNQVVHQYLIPGIVPGAKAVVDKSSGNIVQAFSSVRIVGPNGACLWCNGYITSEGLALEAALPEQRKRQRYVDDPAIPAPSVITLNAMAAGLASNIFLFGVTGLGAPVDYDIIELDALDGDVKLKRKRRDPDCRHCAERLGSGDLLPLTVLPA